jgi:hypothetical protein
MGSARPWGDHRKDRGRIVTPLVKLSSEWLDAKNAEKEATERRRLIEDEICRILEIQESDERTRRLEAEIFTIKITCRINRKVDGDLAQEIAAENGMEEFLPMLFRWKPELSMTAWDAVGDNVKQVFSRAITATPGRPSFSITKD